MKRIATYTTPEREEVHLCYPQEGGKDHGKPACVFYATQEYERRQKKYGIELYPTPTA